MRLSRKAFIFTFAFVQQRERGKEPTLYVAVQVPTGSSVISNVVSSDHAQRPLTTYARAVSSLPSASSSFNAISPVNPRYHGVMGVHSNPWSRRRMLATMSAGLKLGMFVLHPV